MCISNTYLEAVPYGADRGVGLGWRCGEDHGIRQLHRHGRIANSDGLNEPKKKKKKGILGEE